MIRWLAEHEEDGAVAFRIGRDGDELVAEWIGTVRLVARRDGSSHRLEPDPRAHPRELEKVTNGGVRLLLRQLAGEMALHGAAVVSGGAAVVFLGRARHGKSTLAAALCTRPGVALLSDDAVAIDLVRGAELSVTALERAHWLDVDARQALAPGEAPGEEGKRPVPAPRVADRGRLVALVDLAFVEDGAPRLSRASPLEAMAALVPQVVRFVLDEPETNRRELEVLAGLVDRVPVFRLERPRSFALLSESCERVIDLIRELSTAHE